MAGRADGFDRDSGRQGRRERKTRHACDAEMDRIDIPALKKACNQKSQRDPLVVKSEL
jgi:hypothetical protein